MGHEVFICHTTKDGAEATSICELLERHGISCWLAPRNIPPGASWPTEIGNAINNAEVMLVLISSTANLSREVLREVRIADRKQKKIVPIRIENVTVSDKLEFSVGDVQWIDVFPEPILTYWPQIKLAIGQIPASVDKNNIFDVNKKYEKTDAYGAETVNDIKENKKDSIDRKNAIFSNFPAKLTAIGVALSALLGTLTLVVKDVKTLRDAVCDLTRFCDNSDQAALKSAGYDTDKLRSLATDAKTPQAQTEARDRLSVIEKEREDIKSAAWDKTKLTQLANDAKTPQVQAEARDKLGVIEKEEDDIKTAAWDKTKLTPLARAHSPGIRAEATRKLDIVATEQKNYDAAKNDIAGLTEFLAKTCQACLVREEGQRQLEKLSATREQSDEESLKSADYDKTKLTPLASGAHSPEVRAEAGNRLNMLKEIRSRLYELNFYSGQGNDLRQAISDFEIMSKMAETGKPTAELLRRLREAGALQPWGAIVYAPKDRKGGMSWSQDTRQAAVASARAECGSPVRCSEEISFFGTGCGAFAHSSSGWGMAISSSIQQAKEKALSDCRKQGRSCSIIRTICANGAERYESRKQ